MTSLTASSLSHETARLDRAAAERSQRPAEGSEAGGQGFAGLLRAAGVQAAPAAAAGAQPSPLRDAAGRPAAAAEAAQRAARAAAATASAASLTPRTSTSPNTNTNTPDAAERSRASAADRGTGDAVAAPGEADAHESDASDAADGADAAPSTEAAASGPATLAHGLQHPPARAAAPGKGAARSGGGEAKAGAAAAATSADGGSAAGRGPGAADGSALPGWASRDRDTGWVLGRWASGAQAASAGPTADAGAGAGAGAAGQVALDSALAPTAADGALPPLSAPGAEAAQGFAGQLAALMGGGPAGGAPVAGEAVAQAQVHTPVGAPGFGDEVMVKVAALSQDGVQEAQLHLNPAELGPIQVRIAIEGGQARIDFGASADATRQLLESALPALALALQADGLQLSASSVGELAPPAAPEPASAGAADPQDPPQGDLAGQAGGRSGRGWGQQDEAGPGAGRGADARAPAGPAATGRSGDALRGWAGPAAPLAGGSLRGLDLYA